MLIKQWGDVQTARHVMDNEDELTEEPLIPKVEARLDTDASFEFVVVVPATMAVILQKIEKITCGHISIRYPQLQQAEPVEEYDEDEQLYSAAKWDASKRKYPDTDIPLYRVALATRATTATDAPTLAIIVPHLTNAISEKLVATQIVSMAPTSARWLVLAPCQLNNGMAISRLDLSSELFSSVALLRPPHFITGISAAVISALSIQDRGHMVGALVLNSEGHPGFEKVDADSVMDAASEVFRVLFGHESATAEVKSLSGVVRKINSASTSGMYL